MCLGQARGELMGAQRPLYQERDWVKLALSFPFTDVPNTKFVYNNVGPYLAGMLVQRRSGCDLVSYLTPRLLSTWASPGPPGRRTPWATPLGRAGCSSPCQSCTPLGSSTCKTAGGRAASCWTRHGVKASTSKQVENGAYGYGYLFWGGEQGTFRADGKYGQLSILCREKDAVITVVAECREGSALNRAIFDELYPQL